MGATAATTLEQPQVIPSQGDLLGDLLNLDLGPPVNVPQVSSMQMGAVDLLGGGLDSLVSNLGPIKVNVSSPWSLSVQFSSLVQMIQWPQWLLAIPLC